MNALSITGDLFSIYVSFPVFVRFQKQVRQPQYSDYTGDNYWDKMDADNKLYWPKLKYNKYFPQFIKEYGSTPFYKEAFNSCGYLRDFVKQK